MDQIQKTHLFIEFAKHFKKILKILKFKNCSETYNFSSMLEKIDILPIPAGLENFSLIK